MKAWHFIKADRKLGYGDNRLVVDGETLEYMGKEPIKLCRSGLHFSMDVLDALKYASGLIACYVEVDPEAILGDDKGVSRTRKVIKSLDATDIVVKFAILQALSVYQKPAFLKWAAAWLDGSNRLGAAAKAATEAAEAAAEAGEAAAWAAEAAAWAAAWAAAKAAKAAEAARSAAWALEAGNHITKQIQNQLLESMLLEAMGIDKEGNPV